MPNRTLFLASMQAREVGKESGVGCQRSAFPKANLPLTPDSRPLREFLRSPLRHRRWRIDRVLYLRTPQVRQAPSLQMAEDGVADLSCFREGVSAWCSPDWAIPGTGGNQMSCAIKLSCRGDSDDLAHRTSPVPASVAVAEHTLVICAASGRSGALSGASLLHGGSLLRRSEGHASHADSSALPNICSNASTPTIKPLHIVLNRIRTYNQ